MRATAPETLASKSIAELALGELEPLAGALLAVLLALVLARIARQEAEFLQLGRAVRR